MGGPSHAEVAAKLDEIEAEMRRAGIWDASPPRFAPDELSRAAPFGGEVMGFEHWLQLVLLPNARRIVAEGGEFPGRSQVGTFAVRNLDYPEADRLRMLLSDFDRMF